MDFSQFEISSISDFLLKLGDFLISQSPNEFFGAIFVSIIVNSSFLVLASNLFISDESKLKLAIFVEEFSLENFTKSTGIIFDSIFGNEILSTRAFLISSLVSLITFISVFILIYGMKNIAEYNELVISLISIVVVLNFIPDYISICVTRLTVKFLDRQPSIYTQVGLSLVDGFVSFLIIALYLVIYFSIFYNQIPIINTIEGYSILKIVIFSTLLSSIVNLVISVSVLALSKFRNLISKFILENVIIAISLVSSLFVGALLILFYALIFILDYANIDYNTIELMQDSNRNIPDINVTISALLSFFLFQIMLLSAFSQSAVTYVSNIRKSSIFYIQALFTFSIFFIILLKFISPTYISDTHEYEKIDLILKYYFVPNAFPKWQVASAINGIISMSVILYAKIYYFNDQINFTKRIIIKTTRILSVILSSYTICILIYTTISIEWKFLPLCDNWVPWVPGNVDCIF